MTENSNTVVISKTVSGKVAVYARYRRHLPWKQVAACATTEEAEAEAARLEGNSRVRCDVIDEWWLEKWGVDAALTPPPE